jgi:hypothetical protein
LAANDLRARFAEQILPIDQAVAEHSGDLIPRSRRNGVVLSVMDGFFGDCARQRPYVIRRAAFHE